MKDGVLLLYCIMAATSLIHFIEIPDVVPLSALEDACNTNDTESLIACQEPVLLSTATQADLEMIPGISPTLAERIIERKEELLGYAPQLHPDLRYAALTKIKGISLKKAYAIGAYLKVF